MNNPTIGLAPMDGITDAPFRFIVDKYGHPDVLFTEFIPIERLVSCVIPAKAGIQFCRDDPPGRLYDDALSFPPNLFLRHKTITPTIAQLIGVNPEQFYQASIVALSLGFNGIDINMGCPDKSVIKRGSGLALINKPELVKQIIKSVKQAIADHVSSVDPLSFRASDQRVEESPKKTITVSVKTRLGWDKTNYDWFKLLLDTGLDFISIHGRTGSNPYGGQADWDSIAKIVELANESKTKIWGNGDIKNRKQALEKANQYSVAGVLIGRACFGNPWVFIDHEPTAEERKKVMIEHCKKFSEMLPTRDFCSLRKHLAWYCKGFRGSAKLRNQLMKVSSIQDVLSIIL